VSDAAPGRVLRLSLLGWGLGHLALGRRRSGTTWLLAEVAWLMMLALVTWLFVDTTWYLLPFLAGCAFIAVWAYQAVAAYRLALSSGGAIPPAPRGSPAAVIAWLTLPLLAWGTGFWLIGASFASPASVLDRYLAAWPAPTEISTLGSLASNPVQLADSSRTALDRLQQLCAAGELEADCADAPQNLLRDVRIRLEDQGADTATAVAEVVRFERRPSSFLGIFATSELVPVPIEPVIRLELAARAAPLGSARWTIVNAARP
jgi:hypothetical protein